jgi:hypothetical protein
VPNPMPRIIARTHGEGEIAARMVDQALIGA